MIWLVAIAALWVLCFVLSAGWTYAYFCGEYPECIDQDDRKFAYSVSCLGPVSVAVTLQQTDWAKHGWRWPQ